MQNRCVQVKWPAPVQPRKFDLPSVAFAPFKQPFSLLQLKFKIRIEVLHYLPPMPEYTYQTSITTSGYPVPILPLSSFYQTPSLGYLNPLFQQLVNSHSLLQQQINEMKDHTARLKAELDALRTQQIGGFLKGRVENDSNGQKRKKIYKKDKSCPAEGCNKSYSSRIALNAHLRKCHGHRNSRE